LSRSLSEKKSFGTDFAPWTSSVQQL